MTIAVVGVLSSEIAARRLRSGQGASGELWRQVEVIRTAHGVPHIRAENLRAARPGAVLVGGGVVASAGAFGICYSLIGFLRHHPSGGFGALNTVSWGLFLGLFFVLVSVLGALLFPIPMLAFPLLQGRLEVVARLLRQDHLALASTALPHVLAGATLGWLIGRSRHEVQHGI
jgi:hypothetical protein